MTEIPDRLGRYVVPDMPNADELLPWLRRIDHNRWYSNFGPLNSLFEQRITETLGGGIAVTTMMSCYHALQIGLQVMHLPKNAQVLVPAVTFPACPLAVQHAGAVPVLADVDPQNWLLTPQTARTIAAQRPVHAVMPVALYGAPVPVVEWDAFVDETGIPVIIDAAAAFGVQGIPQHCLVAHSLHATKPFAVGEGGLLISRKPEHIAEAQRISNFGTVMRITQQDGTNAKLSEYHAAVGLAQLERRPASMRLRREVYEAFQAAIRTAQLPVTLQPGIVPESAGALMLATKGHNADHIVEQLNAAGIMAHRMYLPPLFDHPHFAMTAKAGICEGAAAMNRAVFGLPFHVFLEPEDIATTVNALSRLLQG